MAEVTMTALRMVETRGPDGTADAVIKGGTVELIASRRPGAGPTTVTVPGGTPDHRRTAVAMTGR